MRQRRKLLWIGSGSVAMCMLGGVHDAYGGNVFAFSSNPAMKNGVIDAKSSYFVGAYSNQNAIYNNTVTGDVVLGGVKVNRATDVPVGSGIAGFAGGPNNNGFYLKSELSKVNDHSNFTSNTLQYTGFASAYVDANGNKLSKAQATNNKPPVNPQKGGAYAVVIDPYNVSSGTAYAYNPIASGSIQLDGVGDTGSMTFWAVDSSVYTADTIENFYADDAPLSQALWSLTVSGSGPTSGPPGVITVDFELNPLALNEIMYPPGYISSLGSFGGNQTLEATAIDGAVDAAAIAALSNNPGNPGEVDLSSTFSPFPAGTTFTAAGGGVEYGDGTEAAIAGIPEPGTAAIVLLASGAGLLRRRNRRV